ncbi:uncharacterized protein SPSK_00927 [Sporothrix schenckii 1099-18]|uniref:Uncharacterized protein n=1 Tax=Sporothrix schenckii 1099-18 TaxID=1397361 RepID=A0A0F2LWL8_SPOSC|nr:uncharacterized protein SPSK_00927 [Sporothrix schenckii 1099-18]KJR81867.1 hypothetical protein SPSK_00927 [Sporothrix schenckii 1099-18]
MNPFLSNSLSPFINIGKKALILNPPVLCSLASDVLGPLDHESGAPHRIFVQDLSKLTGVVGTFRRLAVFTQQGFAHLTVTKAYWAEHELNWVMKPKKITQVQRKD